LHELIQNLGQQVHYAHPIFSNPKTLKKIRDEKRRSQKFHLAFKKGSDTQQAHELLMGKRTQRGIQPHGFVPLSCNTLQLPLLQKETWDSLKQTYRREEKIDSLNQMDKEVGNWVRGKLSCRGIKYAIVEVGDFRQITGHFRGIYRRIYLEGLKPTPEDVNMH
jgi:hypothetical protein